jgi:hypothetical protein
MATSATDMRSTLSGTPKGTSGGWVLIEIPKALCVFTREEFVAALKRGKGWRRRLAVRPRPLGQGPK